MRIKFNNIVVVLGILSFGSACGESGPPPFTAGRTLQRVGEAPDEVSADQLNHGLQLFNRYCASCHGYDGGGAGPAARNLDPKPRDFRTAQFLYGSAVAEGGLPTDRELKAAIRDGVTSRGMPAWAGLRAPDVDALVSYIKAFSPRWQPAPTAPATP